MALFSDGNISTIDDLSAHDTGLMGVAGVEGIDLTRKLALAQEEIGVELMALLPRIEVAAARNSASPALGMENVVVTGPLRLWHAFHSLELVYRDAYNNQLNDRYKGKWEQYRELAGWAAGKLLETGIGVSAEPLAQAEAPRLAAVAGGTAGENTAYYARVAWTNTRGEEGAAGPWNLLVVPAGMALSVEAVNPPANATGWNVYVGFAADEQTLQNAVPLAVWAVWMQAAALESGRKPGDGQRPGYLRAVPRVFQRG
jgi:hypothetical protein